MKAIDINKLKEEANRCFLCKVPKCKKYCPIDTQIPAVIQLFKENKIDEAGEILFNNNPLSAICGVVCPHEDQCLGNCIRGIKDEPVNFYEIESFISREYLKNTKLKQENKLNERIAIIDSGPAGISLALILAKKGYKVTIFEKRSHIGGVLRYGIPKFRLPVGVLDDIENMLLDLNVKIRYNALVGPVITIDKLFEDGYDAIFIGTGVWNPKPLNIKGETFGHVHYAIDYLKSPNSYRLGDNVVIIGAGNVAMDAARTALRLGAEVHIVYRRSESELPARAEEVHHAKEEGIIFDLLTNPVEIVADENGWVKGMKCVRMELGEADASGRRRPVVIPDSEFEMDVDTVIMSLGTSPNPLISSTTIGLDTNKRKCIIADEETGKTTKEGVYAGGDAVTGAATVILAMGAGKAAAKGIDEFIKGKEN